MAVSDIVWEYCKISEFSHHASVFRIDKNPITLILFAQSMMPSVLSVLIGQSTLLFLATDDISMSWLAVCALRCDSPLPTTATPLAGSSSSWDWPVYSAATFPATFSSRFKLDLNERATTNELKRKLGQMATAQWLPRESHATANVSLLA